MDLARPRRRLELATNSIYLDCRKRLLEFGAIAHSTPRERKIRRRRTLCANLYALADQPGRLKAISSPPKPMPLMASTMYCLPFSM